MDARRRLTLCFSLDPAKLMTHNKDK